MFIEFIWKALERFYENDSDLLKGKNVKEECINFRIALYLLDEILISKNEELLQIREKLKTGEIKIDLEYDKYLDNEKIIKEKSSRPDILIHKRGCLEFNFALIELKKGYRSSGDTRKCKGAKANPFYYNNAFIIDCIATPNKIKGVRVIEFLAKEEEIIHRYS
jgi:hypothetical protein